jgi:hypothetical protein
MGRCAARKNVMISSPATSTIQKRRRGRSALSFPSPPGHEGRVALRGTLAFLEGAASEWTARDLAEWFEERLVAPGLLKRPGILRERGATPLLMDSSVQKGGAVEGLVTMSRARVLAALHGFVRREVDDRFLHAAIYAGRVRRTTVTGDPIWIASPHDTDSLSDIVLSLLVADILADREFYRAHLGLCNVCDRVSYKASGASTALCQEHRTATSRFVQNMR